MALSFACEQCGKTFNVDESLAGNLGKCKRCGHIFTIPGPGRKPAAASAAPPRSRPGSSADRPRSAAQPVPQPTLAAPAFDPYGIDDAPAPLPPRRTPLAAFENEEAAVGSEPVQPARTTRKKRRKRGGVTGGWMLGGPVATGLMALLAGLILVGVIVVGISLGSVAGTLAMGAVGLGVILMFIGSIGSLVVAFQESAVCGLMFLFVPFYALYYLITRWDLVRRPFLINLAGTAILIGSAILLPAVNAARMAAAPAAAKNGGGPQAARRPHMPGGNGLLSSLTGSADENVRVVDELVQAINQAADVYDSVHDAHSAIMAQGKLNELSARILQIGSRKLWFQTEADRDRFRQENNPKVEAAVARLVQARDRAGQVGGPGLVSIVGPSHFFSPPSAPGAGPDMPPGIPQPGGPLARPGFPGPGPRFGPRGPMGNPGFPGARFPRRGR